MLMHESESVEFKSIAVDEIKKGIVAFANSGGGTLYVGIDDYGEIVGLEDAHADMMKIDNMLRDGIKPDITLFIQNEIVQIRGKNIIKIKVQKATERPYYLAGKGIRPEGVYVRYGASSVPATDTAIRKMIRETDGDSYEKLRSIEQSLSFNSAKVEFDKRHVEFGTVHMKTLGLASSDKVFTNLALILSEQNVHTIKVAIFQDSSQQTFQDRKEFEGSLFKQLNDVYGYLDINNKTQATYDGLLRIDSRDYPENALREALLNAAVHREYSVSGSILIKMFSDRIEFISPGGLVSGIEIEDIKSGYSICRNPKLAEIFYRLKLIEAYGTGIQKIFEAYNDSNSPPVISVTPNVFKMILPNKNQAQVFTYHYGTDLYVNESPSRHVQYGTGRPNVNWKGKIQSSEDKIMQYVVATGHINRKKAEHILGVSQTKAGQVIRKLVESGALIREGNSRNAVYMVNPIPR